MSNPNKDAVFFFTDVLKDNIRTNMGDLEVNPVSRAIAHYMGIDWSPAGQAAHNCRGIAIVVHGAPLSGRKPFSEPFG